LRRDHSATNNQASDHSNLSHGLRCLPRGAAAAAWTFTLTAAFGAAAAALAVAIAFRAAVAAAPLTAAIAFRAAVAAAIAAATIAFGAAAAATVIASTSAAFRAAVAAAFAWHGKLANTGTFMGNKQLKPIKLRCSSFLAIVAGTWWRITCTCLDKMQQTSARGAIFFFGILIETINHLFLDKNADYGGFV
jgi:hypothetical protein